MMTIDEAIALMANEKICILKADTCDRNCAKCALVKKNRRFAVSLQHGNPFIEHAKEIIRA